MGRVEDKIAVTEGSCNVFADLGFPDPEHELRRAQFAGHIQQVIKRRRLTQTAAAKLMGIDRTTVSALLDGRIGNFSSEQLMRLLAALGQDVAITVEATPLDRSHGEVP